VGTSVGPIHARAVVAADGLRSRLRELLQLERATPRGAHDRIGLRAHLRVGALPFGAAVRILVGKTLEYYVTPVAADEVQVAILGTRAAFFRAELSAVSFFDHLAAHAQLGRLLAGAAAIDRPLGGGPFRQRVARATARSLAASARRAGRSAVGGGAMGRLGALGHALERKTELGLVQRARTRASELEPELPSSS